MPGKISQPNRVPLQLVLGGRWYYCPNDHPYYVDLCGRPTEVLHCAECGLEIGGRNHEPLPGQKEEQDLGAFGRMCLIILI
jgi:hypothetical protein